MNYISTKLLYTKDAYFGKKVGWVFIYFKNIFKHFTFYNAQILALKYKILIIN